MALNLALLIFTTLAVLGHGLSLESNDESADRVSSRLLRREDSDDRKAVGQSDPDELIEPSMDADAEDEEAEDSEPAEEEIQDGTMMSLSTPEPEVLAEGQDASALQENQTGGSSSQSSETSLEEGSENPDEQKQEVAEAEQTGKAEKGTQANKDMEDDTKKAAEKKTRERQKRKEFNKGRGSALEVANDGSKTYKNHHEKGLVTNRIRREASPKAAGPNVKDPDAGEVDVAKAAKTSAEKGKDNAREDAAKTKEKEDQKAKEKKEKRDAEIAEVAKKKANEPEVGGDGTS